MKYSGFHTGPLVRVVLAGLLFTFFVVTSLVFTESHPSMFHPLVSDIFTSPKIKPIDSLTTHRVIEPKPTISSLVDECHSVHKQLNSCHTLPNFFLYETARHKYKNSIINFWHVEKAGGSTIEQCIKDVYKELDLADTFRGTSDCENFMDILSSEHYFKDDTYRPVVRGHNSLALCEFLHEQVTERKCSVFTMFRDPYDRVVSYYFFSRQTARELQEPHDFYSKSLLLPILEWAKLTGSVVRRAFVQKWQIVENGDGEKKCSMVHDSELIENLRGNVEFMEDVLNNLDKYLSVIGLYEELPTTMRMLQRVYDIPFYDNCSTIHRNEGAYDGFSGSARDELKSRAKRELMESEEIRELLKFDLKVYAKAKELFEAQKLELFSMETDGKSYKDVPKR